MRLLYNDLDTGNNIWYTKDAHDKQSDAAFVYDLLLDLFVPQSLFSEVYAGVKETSGVNEVVINYEKGNYSYYITYK